MKKIKILDKELFYHVRKHNKIPTEKITSFYDTEFFGILLSENSIFERFVSNADEIDEIINECNVNNIDLEIQYPLRLTQQIMQYDFYRNGEKDRSIANPSVVILKPKVYEKINQ
jgi:hypothetical protein